jgi:hypothetical protein
MYSPVILDDKEPGKPIYEQSIHNQHLYIQCRFPFLESLFTYDDGRIVGVYENFRWTVPEVINHDARFVVWFITSAISSFDQSNTIRFTNPSELLASINNAKWV